MYLGLVIAASAGVAAGFIMLCGGLEMSRDLPEFLWMGPLVLLLSTGLLLFALLRIARDPAKGKEGCWGTLADLVEVLFR
ncbi:MAG: hypothetical protein K2R98_07515 [Gemmataceae bacterium]|nr:hypothetical protein [Gemmataceae bacterium]